MREKDSEYLESHVFIFFNVEQFSVGRSLCEISLGQTFDQTC
jgi:hypothetical protein